MIEVMYSDVAAVRPLGAARAQNWGERREARSSEDVTVYPEKSRNRYEKRRMKD